MKAKNDHAKDLIRLFATPSAWEAWLDKNHRTSAGVWRERIHEPRKARRK